ncbi:hypothetical protein SUDANB37_04057 [Streptomyces sp. enrichment culture]
MTYDYAGVVLFNNYAGQLRQRFINRLRREIAARASTTQRELKERPTLVREGRRVLETRRRALARK